MQRWGTRPALSRAQGACRTVRRTSTDSAPMPPDAPMSAAGHARAAGPVHVAGPVRVAGSGSATTPRHPAEVACAVVDGLAQTILVAGAVAGIGWVVTLAAVGFVGAGLWAALSGDREPGAVPVTGWWTTTFLLAASLAATSGPLFARLLGLLGVLALLGLGLSAVANPPTRRAGQGPTAAPEGSPPLRRRDAASSA